MWVVKGRKMGKSVIDSCITCYKESEKAEVQFMANLPDWKLEQQRLFPVIGADLFGTL